MTCRELEKQLSKGRFNESLNTLSTEQKGHLTECRQCRETFDSLVKFEADLFKNNPESCSRQTQARISENVLNRLTLKSTPKKFFSTTPILYASMAVACIVMIISVISFKQIGSSPIDTVSRIQLTEIDTDLIELSIDETATIDDFDDTALVAAIANQFDTEILDLASEESNEESDIYNSEVLSKFSEFSELEWEEFRRFLS